MTDGLEIPPDFRPWLGQIATRAGLDPRQDGERWLLHLTPGYPNAKTTTLQVRWAGAHWQLLGINNAEEWPITDQPVDEICFDCARNSFWRYQAGPVPPMEQARILARVVADLQHNRTSHGFAIVHDPLSREELPAIQSTAFHHEGALPR